MALQTSFENIDNELYELLLYLDEINGITTEHYNIFIKYLLIDKNIIEAPKKVKHLWTKMESDLNALGVQKSNSEWLKILKDWKHKICKEYEKDNDKKFTSKQLELVNIFQTSDMSYIPESEIGCILDHVQQSHDSQLLWHAIAIKMLSFGIDEKVAYWKMLFEKWCQHVSKRRTMLSKWDGEALNGKRPKILSNLSNHEIRTIKILSYYNVEHYNTEGNSEKYERVCRICLTSSKDNMLELFNKYRGPIHYVNKINFCAGISPVKIDDGYPQYICIQCRELVETAFKFKTLCEKSDFLLRTNLNALDTMNIENDPTLLIESGIEKFTDSVKPDDSEDDNVSDDYFMVDDNSDSEYINFSGPFQHDINIDNGNMCSIEKNLDIENGDKFQSVLATVENQKKMRRGYKKSKQTYECETCGLKLSGLGKLAVHMKIHIRKEYKCKDCGNLYSLMKDLTAHRKKHIGAHKFVCEICAKSYTTLHGLDTHREGHLETPKYYHCTITTCEYKTRYPNDIKTHLRTHTGEKPFQCNICAKSFSTRSNLYKHRWIHTDTSYKCELCPSTFKSHTSFSKHIKMHSGYSKPLLHCEVCDNKYSSGCALRKHLRKYHPEVEIPKRFYHKPNSKYNYN